MNSEVTIVILTRDRPDFLEKCLKSVFEHQKVVPEVIVSDNSTREHIAIKKLRSKYPFTYVRQSGELSMTEHHNACLKLPSTRWLWLVHDDDELYPESVVKVQSFLAGCRNVGIVLGGVEYIDPQGRTVGKWMPKMNGTFRGEAGLLGVGLDFGAFSPGTIFTIAASREIGGFIDINGVCADYPLSVRLAFSYGVAFLPELVGRFRMGHRQSSDYSTPEKAEALLDFVMREGELMRSIGCSRGAAEQIIDYTTWETFLKVGPPWLQSHESFVFRLAQKCLRVSPRPGEWQNRARQQYPFLFWRLQWLSWPLFQAAKSAIPAPLRRWLRAQSGY
jgi:glycosyltransferase involved in cell wall biosynthesis